MPGCPALKMMQTQMSTNEDPAMVRKSTTLTGERGLSASRESVSGLPMTGLTQPLCRVGLAADHGGFELKGFLAGRLRSAGHDVTEFGGARLDPDDDYPDVVLLLARAVARGDVERGVALCGSGVGACIVANKVPGIRACLIHETYSAHQGVEDDDMNVICLGGRVVGCALAWELVASFVAARFVAADRHQRRLAKITALECSMVGA